MEESEFPALFTAQDIAVGGATLQTRWQGWTTEWRTRLVKLVNAAHALGLDWYAANGPGVHHVLRAARKELGANAVAGTVALIIGCPDGSPTVTSYRRPANDPVTLDLTELDQLDAQGAIRWLTSKLGNVPQPRTGGRAYWPSNYEWDITEPPPPPPQQKNPMKLNTILFGPPGTGKTFATTTYALSLFGNEPQSGRPRATPVGIQVARTQAEKQSTSDTWPKLIKQFDALQAQGRIEFTTFHQNYAYEDFVEGIRAEPVEGGGIAYSTRPGVFKRIAYRALYAWLTGKAFPIGNRDDEEAANERVSAWLRTGQHAEDCEKQPDDDAAPPYVLIIDEINRGNMARILGELITLLEDSKRARRRVASGLQPLRVTLPCTQEPFILPPNLYILGTMNTADRSLIGLDIALRRRFDFVELCPQPDLLSNDIEGVNLQEFLKAINSRIEERLDADHLIGHAFLMGVNSLDSLAQAMQRKVIPQLREYFHDRPQDLRAVLARADNAETCEFLKFSDQGRNMRLISVNLTGLDKAQTYRLVYSAADRPDNS